MEKLRILVVLTLVALILAANGPLSLDKNVTLDFKGNLNNNSLTTILTGLIWGVNKDSQTKGQRADMIVDYGLQGIYVADKASGDYGITCDDNLNCVTKMKSKTCPYGGIDLVCDDEAQALLRFKEQSASADSTKLQFGYFTSTTAWTDKFGKSGVLGLHPKSAFWKFFTDAYEKPSSQSYIEVSVNYRVKDSAKIFKASDISITDSHWILNGRYGVNEPIVQKFDTTQDAWVYNGVDISVKGGEIKNGEICVDNTSLVYFSFKDYPAISKAIFNELCGKDTCKKDGSNTSNVSDIKATFEKDNTKFSITVSGKDFVGFDSEDNAILAIGDIANSPACSKHQSATGMLFLTKAEFIVRATSGTEFEIGFNEIEYPNDAIFLIILIVLGCLILAIIVAIVLINTCKRKRDQAAQGGYSNADQEEKA